MALSLYAAARETDDPSPILGPVYDVQSEVADALLGFLDPIDVPALDSLFDDDDGAQRDGYDLFPSYSDPSILSLPYPAPDDFDCCRCPKRPRSCGDLYVDVRPPTNVVAFDASCLHSSTGDVRSVAARAEEEKKGGGGGLSAQSAAARERRKRISEKTQELGRLIPGGNKMNTAEMFQAAFKYVKFLQAQVGILAVMESSTQESKASTKAEEQLQVLVTSPTIQEKLSGEGKCIVTKKVVEALVEEPEIKSAPVIARDLDRFVRSMG